MPIHVERKGWRRERGGRKAIVELLDPGGRDDRGLRERNALPRAGIANDAVLRREFRGLRSYCTRCCPTSKEPNGGNRRRRDREAEFHLERHEIDSRTRGV